jgi:FkbM family methyltransferase
MSVVRSLVVGSAYKAIANGLRLLTSKMVSDFQQWSNLIDLVRKLKINVFLDVGANRGFFSKHLRMAGFSGHIFSFEPILEDYERIKQLADGDDKWVACGYALGSESGLKSFNINRVSNNETVLSSFLPLKDSAEVTKSTIVEIRRLDDVLPELMQGIDTPRIFLKMDTQGFDGEVISGSTLSLKNVFGIQSELAVVPLYEGMRPYTESPSRYEGLGFRLMDLFVVNRTEIGGVLGV